MNDSQQHRTTVDVDTAAEQDAGYDVRKVHWFFIGFCGNILGILIASVYEPTPPASRLLGKSPEYVASYTDSYKETGRRIQVNQARIGLLIVFGLAILFTVITS
ncbi:MAG: hypothetical protein OXH00_06630 [Candidatus Poribacteria bacterium]|nr:hypothetical protein [Candidatus Poribacteria bacterium]